MNFSDKASGFLFVGDPHMTDRKPGRRKEKDFPSMVLNKLEQAVDIANEKNYVMVILGDLLERPKLESESLKTRLARVLKKAKYRPISNLGNHERKNAKLSDDDTISYLATSEVIDLISESGPYGVFDCEGVRIGLGGTPYGEEIPRDVTGMFDDCKTVIWITHHDLEFEGAYPNSIPTHEIEGCRLVVNGHMHLQKKPKQEGKTFWFNPGNITRQAIDAMEHTPRVYGLNKAGKLEPFELVHQKDVFDLTGRLVDSISEEMDDESMESVFVQLIQVEESADYSKTEDGSVIRETMETKFERDDIDPKVRSVVIGLLNDVLEDA